MYLQANRNVSLTAFNADEILTSVTQKATKERKCKEEYAESKQGDLSIVDWRKGRDPTLSEGGGRRIGCAKTLARAHSVGDLNFNLTASNLSHLHQRTPPLRSRHAIAMPLPRPVALTRVANSISSQSSALVISQRIGVRAFSQSTERKAADHAHEDHYDPPSGWLFGVKPGEKAEKEGWETVWIWGFFGSLGLGVVAYAFKPDTS
jgi:hypothetical protein